MRAGEGEAGNRHSAWHKAGSGKEVETVVGEGRGILLLRWESLESRFRC